MSVALVDLRRDAEGGFRPAGVWLCTPRTIDARYLRGVAELEAFRARVIAQARPPLVDVVHGLRGDWEDWARWAAATLSNGNDRLVREVEPEPTLHQLYLREVAGHARPRPARAPRVTVLEAPPVGELCGWRVRPPR